MGQVRFASAMTRRRKRSAAITLVLAGTLAGCGEPPPQRDVYTSLASCQRDWNQPGDCEPVRDNRYASSWYYGPSHYGSSYGGTGFGSSRPRPSPNAVEAFSAPGTRAVSRGGFGASARSHSVSS